MVDQLLANQISEKIKHAQKILVLGHSNPRPDGDSLGSTLALGHYLKNIKKDFVTFCFYPAEERLKFLPGAGEITSQPEKIEIEKYDLIIMLDFGQFKNSGLEEKLNLAKKAGIFFIQIDHHPLMAEAADLTVVVEDASSTCEILYNIFIQTGAEIDRNMANCLLTGILTDTENFTNLGTTFTSLKAGAELLKYGARLQEIITNLWHNKKLSTLRLWGKVLLRLEKDPKTGIATTAIMLKDLEEENLTLEATGGIANFLNSLGEARAITVLCEEEGGKVKGSLRTTRDDVDVAEIARKYGGGGHRKAAGFLISGQIVKTDNGWMVVE